MTINLEELKNVIVIIKRGKYYGCVKDKHGNTIKKGFETRDEAKDWISNKDEYTSRWTE